MRIEVTGYKLYPDEFIKEYYFTEDKTIEILNEDGNYEELSEIDFEVDSYV